MEGPKNKQLVAWVSRNASSPALIVMQHIDPPPILFNYTGFDSCSDYLMHQLGALVAGDRLVLMCVCVCVCTRKDARSQDIHGHIFPALGWCLIGDVALQSLCAGPAFKIRSSTHLLEQQGCWAAGD